jgi:hypothetical protein
MAPNLIDLRRPRGPSSNDVAGLENCLAQLVGEPFRLARVSYGDELTLHFGDLRPARSPKLNGQMYGAYILGVRATPWVLKGGAEPVVINAGVLVSPAPPESAGPLRSEDLEASPPIKPESRVLSATPFMVEPAEAFGLQLRLSDGSSFLVLPAAAGEVDAGDAALPALADWELISPRGLLSAGPSRTWSFEPAEVPAANP